MPASSAGVLRREQAEAVPHVSFELLTNAEMMRADQRTIADGTDGYTLMKRAGLAVAEAAADLAEEGLILVIAGRGNNGGDGFVAATELLRRGRDVAVMLLCQRDTLKGDAALAARDWPGEVLPCDPAALGEAALIIDALFGAGLDRPVKGDPRELIEAMNASGAPILSVDLPSGINGSSGQVLGVAVNATESVTFFRKKPGHLLLPGRMHCGRVRLADIGIADAVLGEIGVTTFENLPEFWRAAFPLPRLDGHKYSRGHALIASGGLAMTGAARLSARGALRAGAGLVTVATPREALSRECGGTDGGDGAACGYGDRVRRTSVGQPLQRLRDRARLRRRRAHARSGADRDRRRTRRRPRCGRADELRRRAANAVRCDCRGGAGARRADAA